MQIAYSGEKGNMGIPDFDACMTADATSLADLVTQVVAEDAASMPVLDSRCRELLLEETTVLPFRRARDEVRLNESAVVRQDFDLCDDIPAASAFWHCTAVLERHLNEALTKVAPCPLAPPIRLNDLIVQRYPAGSLGITPHRDHVRYRGLIVLLVLGGYGRYYVCSDREGSGAREISAPPGHMILMRAPDFAGRRDRPFHFLTDVTSERFSFGIRHDATA